MNRYIALPARALVALLILLLMTTEASAGPRRRGPLRRGYPTRLRFARQAEVADTPAIVRAFADSLAQARARVDSSFLENANFSENANSRRVTTAEGFQLFAPLTYYPAVTHRLMEGRPADASSQSADASSPSKDASSQWKDASGVYKRQAADRALMAAYLACANRVTQTDSEVRRAGELHSELTRPISNRVELGSSDDIITLDRADDPFFLVVERPNFWTFGGDYYLQFLQNYVSGNWYKGGESNYSMVASATFKADYNNKQKVKFENKLEMKLGFQTSKGDSLHSFKTSEDLIRYTGKLGLQASKRWYYTLQLVAYTQFMRGYKSNDRTVYSDLMAPFNANLSLGMSYTVDALDHRLKGSVQMAPLATNYRFVSRRALATRYGLDEGKRQKVDFGSECTVDLEWLLSENIKWKTRLYGYTTYERTEIEWENTVSFQFNRYISSNVFVYPRFDDGASKRDDHHGYWQFKEYASIGFSYSF